MNFYQLLRVLWARKWIAIAIALTVLLTTTIVSFLIPKSYSASTSLVLDFKGSDPVNGNNSIPIQLLPGYMATQIDIISSQRVALKVVDALKLVDNFAVREDFQKATKGKGNIREWLATLLSKKLDVKPSKESSVVALSYAGADPDRKSVV